MEDQMSFYDDYWVTATFADETEQVIGEVVLPSPLAVTEMPTSLEINGVEYKAQF